MIRNIALVFFFVFYSSVSIADVQIDSVVIDRSAANAQSNAFQFSPVGKLMSGPIRAIGEPTDYSSIVNFTFIQSTFLRSVFACYEGRHYCSDTIFRWKNKSLKLKPIFDAQIENQFSFDKISEVLDDTLAAFDFEVIAEAKIENSNLVLVIGNPSYLRKKMRERNDQYALDYIDTQVPERTFMQRLAGKPESTDPFCYTSTKDRFSVQRVEIFLNPAGINHCLSNALAVSIGLFPTALDIPSVTDKSLNYKAATFADVLFAEILYHADFPLNGSREQVEAFFNAHANTIRNQLIKKLID